MLWRWKRAVIERIAMLRLTVHPEAQVAPICDRVPWLGFVGSSCIPPTVGRCDFFAPLKDSHCQDFQVCFAAFALP